MLKIGAHQMGQQIRLSAEADFEGLDVLKQLLGKYKEILALLAENEQAERLAQQAAEGRDG